jgi:SAM-dependent methyltransferase
VSDPYSRVQYRRLIAWPERIRREWPFLDKVLSSGPVRRVLDLGCGTGEHSRFLAAQGFEVVGVDASASMLAKALEEPLPPNLRFVAGDVSRLDEIGDDLGDEPFGGAICLGNTLPHLQTREELAGLARGLRRRLAAGAPVLLQLLNYERIFAQRVRHLPLNFRPGDDGQLVFLRLMEPQEGGRVLFFPTTLELVPGGDPPVRVISSRQVELHGWRWSELEPILAAERFRSEVYGDFDGSPWTAGESHDLIVVAR